MLRPLLRKTNLPTAQYTATFRNLMNWSTAILLPILHTSLLSLSVRSLNCRKHQQRRPHRRGESKRSTTVPRRAPAKVCYYFYPWDIFTRSCLLTLL